MTTPILPTLPTTIPTPTDLTLPPTPTDLFEITALETPLLFPTFTSSTAWTLGTLLRTRLLTLYPSTPTCISITLANGTPLFYCAVVPGTTPDNSAWVARKTATVLRFGRSSWYMGRKFSGDEEAFRAKYGLGERGRDYAIHGGAVPVRVVGVEGVVGVVCVSGLRQEEDHMVVVQCMRELLGVGTAVGGESEAEKRKED